MIVGVCADKGSPGVTTLSTALGMVWPGERLLMEADPSGGDLAFWARHATSGDLLAADPSVLTLAADARTGLPADVLPHYAQPTLWGIPVVQGAPGEQGFAAMRTLWPSVAAEAARWSGTVIADLGRLQPGNAARPMAKAATALLVLARVSVEGLYHLRDRVADLAHAVGDPSRDRNPVAVVVVARRDEAKDAVRQVTRMLVAVGSPIPVAGVFMLDDVAVRELHAGQAGRRLTGSDLLRSANNLVDTVLSWWPELDPAAGNSAVTSPKALSAAPPKAREAAR